MPQARTEFDLWYEEHKDDMFDFQKELKSYCWMDVQILKQGCLSFRKLMMQVSCHKMSACNITIMKSFQKQSFDPFAYATTIASTCMHAYRLNFMASKMLAIVPHGGYRRSEKQSIMAIKWLKWVSETEELDIQHARNGQEGKIGPYKVRMRVFIVAIKQFSSNA